MCLTTEDAKKAQRTQRNVVNLTIVQIYNNSPPYFRFLLNTKIRISLILYFITFVKKLNLNTMSKTFLSGLISGLNFFLQVL